ncbi:MAG: sigma-54-dependent Fis family transcriptional regulator [Calditrichales bacterium]|nr:MAG: sigma-54-dependent Fis family transcriptional regulator [Calditrichales bacterium]
MSKENILIVDDQVEILSALDRLLKEEYNIYTSPSGENALKLLKEKKFSVILADQRMPGMTGVEFMSKSIELQPEIIRILITAYADIEASIDAVNKAKIYYYISKPWEPEELKLIVKRAVERYQLLRENHDLTIQLQKANELLRQENQYLRQNIRENYDFKGIIGQSPKMLDVFKLTSKVINTPTTVLILGETGTGKELLARAIHFNSQRKDFNFIAQNCGALPDTLLESELFGHVRGAFTGAIADRKGIFAQADKGTVFLDEIADTSPALQLRLLRILQEGEYKPVGGTKMMHVDVRVIAATNKDIDTEVSSGRFREDLYYRLNVFPINLPPLRERRDDINDLITHFLKIFSKKINKQIKGISPDAMKILISAPYPGNIRELENEIERTVTLADENGFITSDLLSHRFHTVSLDPGEPVNAEGLKDQVETLEKKMILAALKETKGNILRAAEILQLSRAGLHKKLIRYQIKAKYM